MKIDEKNEVMQGMKDAGVLEYGSTMTRESLLAWWSVKPVTDDELENMRPSVIRKRLQEDSLKELAVADFVRSQLMKDGKYFYCENGAYRVALPSENASIAEKYIRQSKRKLSKASRLISTTPKEFMQPDMLKSRAALAHAFGVRQSQRNDH